MLYYLVTAICHIEQKSLTFAVGGYREAQFINTLNAQHVYVREALLSIGVLTRGQVQVMEPVNAKIKSYTKAARDYFHGAATLIILTTRFLTRPQRAIFPVLLQDLVTSYLGAYLGLTGVETEPKALLIADNVSDNKNPHKEDESTKRQDQARFQDYQWT
ncbi:hypothetical protein DOTSEDRAFT_24931 [Dothistroma septosporum NZE10]|uniref:Uncharacterized protein n=1 Tax=Dothistroma septosporum (strain NZE10 / CBS 128990) TaxID=675120 RepID=M2YLQ2_DOTSN|nr:hypothetical protein DOTSEDRAFT_24931 [Dothistroma septosporum NZE10]